MSKHECDGLCDECRRPVEKCHGQPKNRSTPYERGAYKAGEQKVNQFGSAVHDAPHPFGGKKR